MALNFSVLPRSTGATKICELRKRCACGRVAESGAGYRHAAGLGGSSWYWCGSIQVLEQALIASGTELTTALLNVPGRRRRGTGPA